MNRNVAEQEQQVNAAFSRQSKGFDALEEHNPIIHRMRQRVWAHVLALLKPGASILELNAGTGIDALFFARQDFTVHATDNADGMLMMLSEKVQQQGLPEKVTVSKCSFNHLAQLEGQQYDHIFSNFGGLNCTATLDKVIESFDALLKPGGTVTLVIMPPVCPWELQAAFRFKFKFAFRRFKKHGAPAHIEGVHFTTYYYTPSYVLKAFGNNYQTVALEGLASISPPPCFECFPYRFPRLYKWLVKQEERFCSRWPFTTWADHFMLSVQKQASA